MHPRPYRRSKRSTESRSRIASNPRAAFDGHTVETPWDDLNLAYFSGYAMWNYLNTPFIFALPGFQTEEIEPWDENGEKRRRLKVTFPDHIATHCPEQIFHVNGEGLICRVDYSAPVAGGAPTAHYLSEHRDFSGIKVATKRRALRRNADGTAIPDPVFVAIDIADAQLLMIDLARVGENRHDSIPLKGITS